MARVRTCDCTSCGKDKSAGNRLVSYDMCAHKLQGSHYWNLVHLMTYSFVNFVTYLVSSKGKCYTCDIIVLNELT
jgi:hypothetical protein